MRKISRSGAIIFSFSFLVLMGCLPTAYQSPRVLQPHEQALGLGGSFFVPGDLAVFYRQGVFRRMDFGIKAGGLPSFGYGFFFDLKYGMLEQPFLLSLDLGFSSSHFTNYFDPGNEEKAWAWHPALLFGGKHIYGGLGWHDYRFREWKLPMNESPYTLFSRDSFPGLKLGIIGYSVSERWEVNLELNYYHSSSEYFPRGVTFGFGVRRIFRPHKPEN